MADQIIQTVKTANQERYIQIVEDFDKQSIALKAEAAPQLLMMKEVYEDAIKIQGNVIYNKTVECDGLRNQIGSVDENSLRKNVGWRKLNDTNADKNKVIYDELMKELDKSPSSNNKAIQMKDNNQAKKP